MSGALLIHGAWHGAWAWDKVAPLLDGHEVTAPDLPGCGADRASLSPGITLSDHVAAALPDHPVVICAHSYGGVVARLIVDRRPDLVAGLVLLEALWPETGQSALDQLSDAARDATETAIAERGDGWRIPPPDAAQFDLPDPAMAQRINDAMSDHPASTFRERLTVAPLSVKGTYVIATDRRIQPYTATAERVRALGWTILETHGGHELPLTRPDLVADLLRAAA